VLTGGQAISEDLGHQDGRTSRSPCSVAPKKVMIDKENTTIVSGAGKKARHRGPASIRSRRRSRKTTSDYDREKLQERLAKPRRRPVAVIRVGGRDRG